MTSQLATIVRELETKLTAINKALDALREVDGDIDIETVETSIPEPTKTRKKFSAETRRKMRLSQLARYKRARAEANKVPF